MAEDNLRGLLEYLAKSIVDNPDSVTIEQFESGKTVHLDLRVHPDDIGRVIGKRGRVANSMRAILKVVAARNGQRVEMDVVDLD
ncbi:MAG: KH domain-containing protein [Anaerolineaceae bacterium]|nr:KH domain-containing protein [Anaerolineaceae bacterium]